MGKIEFKTQVVDGMLKIPDQFKDIHNSIVSVILEEELIEKREYDANPNNNSILTDRRSLGTMLNMAEIKKKSLDFSQINIECFKNINPLEYQRNIRDGK
jgi:hypothetical protein